MSTAAMPMMTSGADLLAATPADLFTGMDSAPAGDLVVDDIPADEPLVDDEPEPVDDAPVEDAVDDAPVALDAVGDAPEATPATPAEDLPEGVIKTKDSKGKFKYNLDENRYKTVYGHHQLVQQLAETLNETPTLEALSLRNEAYLAQERLFSTLESGDMNRQAEAVKYMISEMREAQQNGRVGIDPTVPFAHSVYKTMQTEAPEAFRNVQLLAARDVLGDMFAIAAQSNDQNLYHSARRIVAAMSGVGVKPENVTTEQYLANIRQEADKRGLPFPSEAELSGYQQQAPPDPRDREIAELRAQVQQKPGPTDAERYRTWQQASIADVNRAVLDDAVMPSLASVKDGWKEFPDDFKRLVTDPLNREVATAVRNDAGLHSQVKQLQDQAKRATSEQVRTDIANRIKGLMVHRAKIAADKVKGPMITFAADWLKGQSSRTHERRTGAQNHTQPKGTGTPVKTSLLPPDLGMKGGIFDAKVAARQAAALLAGVR